MSCSKPLPAGKVSSSSAAADVEEMAVVVREKGAPVECSTEGCTTTDKWRRMKSERGDDDKWVYTCFMCIAVQMGMTHEEAKAFIMTQGRGYQQKMARINRFKTASAEMQELFFMLKDLPKRETYQMTMEEMKDMWSRLSSFILRKGEVTERAVKDMDGFQELKAAL